MVVSISPAMASMKSNCFSVAQSSTAFDQKSENTSPVANPSFGQSATKSFADVAKVAFWGTLALVATAVGGYGTVVKLMEWGIL